MHQPVVRKYPLIRTVALYAMAGAAWCAHAGEIKPPPLPPGSAQVKIESGQSPEENKRMLRAHKHHHQFHNRKDYTRDDTMDDTIDSDQPAPVTKVPKARQAP